MTINQYLPDEDEPQVLYQGRWVDRKNFRAFVYSADKSKLANSYEEYSKMIGSGLWFSSQDEVRSKDPINIRSLRAGRKPKNGSSIS